MVAIQDIIRIHFKLFREPARGLDNVARNAKGRPGAGIGGGTEEPRKNRNTRKWSSDSRDHRSRPELSDHGACEGVAPLMFIGRGKRANLQSAGSGGGTEEPRKKRNTRKPSKDSQDRLFCAVLSEHGGLRRSRSANAYGERKTGEYTKRDLPSKHRAIPRQRGRLFERIRQMGSGAPGPSPHALPSPDLICEFGGGPYRADADVVINSRLHGAERPLAACEIQTDGTAVVQECTNA